MTAVLCLTTLVAGTAAMSRVPAGHGLKDGSSGRLEASVPGGMSLDAALQALPGIPDARPALVAEVQQLLGAGNKTRSFLHASGAGAGPEVAPEKMISIVTDWIGAILEKKRAEYDKCWVDFHPRATRVLEKSTQAVSSMTSAVTKQRAAAMTVQTQIEVLTKQTPRLEENLAQNQQQCEKVIGEYNRRIPIVQGDIEVMKNVVRMAECGSGAKTAAAELLSCCVQPSRTRPGEAPPSSFVTPRRPELRRDLDELRSPIAKQLVHEVLGDAAATLDGASAQAAKPPAALSQQTQATALSGEPVGGTVDQPQDDATAGVSPQDVEQLKAKCTCRSQTNCVKIYNKFVTILAGVEDGETDLRNQLDHFEGQCTTKQAAMQAQIQNNNVLLAEKQKSLARIQKALKAAEEQSQAKGDEKLTLQTQLKDTMGQCDTNLAAFDKELDALRRIRNEISKRASNDGVPELYQDCDVSPWTARECSVACGGGTQEFFRTVVQPPNKGAPCPELARNGTCNEQDCPVDCEMAEWTSWTPCTKECGGGTTERTRAINTTAAYGGLACSATSETAICAMQACHQDCELSLWSNWSNCSKQCGGGHNTSTKSVAAPAKGEGFCPGEDAPERLRLQQCNEAPCELPPGNTTFMCDSKLDIILVLDGSSSLGPEGWEATKQAGAGIAKSVVGGPEKGRVAAIRFSGPLTLDGYLKCTGAAEPGLDIEEVCLLKRVSDFSTDTAAVAQQILDLSYPEGITFTSMALKTARGMLEFSREDATPVVLVITDGKPNSIYKTNLVAEKLRTEARLMFVPLGPYAPADSFVEWGSKPTKENVIAVASNEELKSQTFINRIVENLCPKLFFK